MKSLLIGAGIALALLLTLAATTLPTGKKYHELNKGGPAGRPLAIPATPGVNVHELDKNDHDLLFLTFTNTDTVARYVDVSFNATTIRVHIPALDHAKIENWAISGRSNDGTEVSNKNVICVASVADKITLIGSAQ